MMIFKMMDMAMMNVDDGDTKAEDVDSQNDDNPDNNDDIEGMTVETASCMHSWAEMAEMKLKVDLQYVEFSRCRSGSSKTVWNRSTCYLTKESENFVMKIIDSRSRA